MFKRKRLKIVHTRSYIASDLPTWEFYIEQKTGLYTNANVNNQLMTDQIISLKVN